MLLLEAFDALGKHRGIPRMRVHALAEQARAHAEQGRFESAERALRKMESVAVALDTPDFLPLREGCRLTMAMAQACVALLKKDATGAMEWLETADRLARRSIAAAIRNACVRCGVSPPRCKVNRAAPR